jgi:hypothetical protein
MKKNFDPDIGKNTRFTSENQPENRGAKKNRFKHLQNQFELSSIDVNSIIEYISSVSVEELKDIQTDKKQPVIIKAFAKAALNAVDKGDLSQFEKMLDRVIGKVKDNIDMNLNADIATREFKIVNPEDDGEEGVK